VHFRKDNKQRVYDFLRRYIAGRSYAPTIAEISLHINLSSFASIHRILSQLESEGLILRTPNISRGIELVDKSTCFIAPAPGEPPPDHDEFSLASEYEPRRFVDPGTLRQRDRYVKDWRQRMATWRNLQREWMPAHYVSSVTRD
jgi:SOS-response transcriptional repressors (RecA-mediated autopeptidases)